MLCHKDGSVALISLDATTGKELSSYHLLSSDRLCCSPLYILDDVVYYGVFGDGEKRDTLLGAVDTITGRSVQSEYKSAHRPGRMLFAFHPHCKVVLGVTKHSVALLWHN